MNVRDAEFDRLLAEWLEDDSFVASASPVEAAVDFARTHPRRRDWLAFLRRDAMTGSTGLRPVAILVAIVAVLVLTVGGAVLIGSRPDATPSPAPGPVTPSAQAASCAANPASPPVAQEGWTGPVRSRSASVISMSPRDGGGRLSMDEHDSARRYVEIEQVHAGSVAGQPTWRLVLASAPPKATTLDPACTVISYGLTFDTTGDGDADYVVGVSNQAPQAGDYRAWITDLATGDTTEQVGPPYGYPIEFGHPDELSPDELRRFQPAMSFTFLPGTRVDGIDHTTKFYAWASVEEDGQLVAWDYAPDAGWLNP